MVLRKANPNIGATVELIGSLLGVLVILFLIVSWVPRNHQLLMTTPAPIFFAAIGLGILATLLLLHKGIVVWDPSIYYFTRIPSEVDRFTALTTALGGVVFSVVGSAIPAARAADTDPVQSLRYE